MDAAGAEDVVGVVDVVGAAGVADAGGAAAEALEAATRLRTHACYCLVWVTVPVEPFVPVPTTLRGSDFSDRVDSFQLP